MEKHSMQVSITINIKLYVYSIHIPRQRCRAVVLPQHGLWCQYCSQVKENTEKLIVTMYNLISDNDWIADVVPIVRWENLDENKA